MRSNCTEKKKGRRDKEERRQSRRLGIKTGTVGGKGTVRRMSADTQRTRYER